jgi:glycosyltransferase involved in cell wall biosynthesis
MSISIAELGIDVSMLDTRLAVVIPAYNEGLSIARVVHQIKHQALAIVIDDGSTDNTSEQARNAGAHLIRHSVNLGYDASLETGIRTAISLGCTMVVTMDADGQHDASMLGRFYAELEKGADLVIGVRDRTQRWAEIIFSKVGRFVWGLDDLLSGMKGYRVSKIDELYEFNRYNSIGTELALMFIAKNAIAVKVKISTHLRHDNSRFGSGIYSNLKILKSLILGIYLYGLSSKNQKSIQE